MNKRLIAATIISVLIGMASASALAQLPVKKLTAMKTIATKKASVVKSVKTVDTKTLQTRNPNSQQHAPAPKTFQPVTKPSALTTGKPMTTNPGGLAVGSKTTGPKKVCFERSSDVSQTLKTVPCPAHETPGIN